MEQLLDHLPTYTNSPCGGKFGLDRSYVESVLQRQKLCFIWCLHAVDGIQPCGGVLWGQWKLGKLAGDVSFQQLLQWRCVVCSISLSMYSSLQRRNYCPTLVIRKWRGSHLFEVTQVVKVEPKLGAMSEPHCPHCARMSQALWNSSFWTLQRKFSHNKQDTFHLCSTWTFTEGFTVHYFICFSQ